MGGIDMKQFNSEERAKKWDEPTSHFVTDNTE